FAFLSEHITDVYAAYLDMLHGMGTHPDAPGAEEAGAAQPAYLSFPALFRYTFPECIVTIRNGSPRIQPRQLAYGFVYGLRYEMESRYRSDRNYLREGRTPEWTEHARKIGRLRRDYEDLLLLGRYRDQEGFACNPKLVAARFAGDKREGIALWNDTDSSQRISLCMPGFRVVQWAKADGAGQGALDCLLPGEIALLILAPE
ncbi:MAG TPA: hypothetical protein PKE04_11635, partial [Clostridia bacterium]|nr:hypothetical protein [Clostridia bacterium]